MSQRRGRAWKHAAFVVGLGTSLVMSAAVPAVAAQPPGAATGGGAGHARHTVAPIHSPGLGYGIPSPPPALNDRMHAAPYTLPVNGYDVSPLNATSVDQSVLPVGVLSQRNFFSTLSQWEAQGAKIVPPNVTITIPATDYWKTSGGNPGVTTIPAGKLDGNNAPALGWPTSVNDIYYKFHVARTGLYALSLTYYDYPGCFKPGQRSLKSFTTNEVLTVNPVWCGKDSSAERSFLIDPPGTVPVATIGSGAPQTSPQVLKALKSAGLNPANVPQWINPSSGAPPTATAPAWAIPSAKNPKSQPCALDLSGPSGMQNYDGYQYQEQEQSPFPEEWTLTGKKVLPNGIVEFPKDNVGDDLFPVPVETEAWQTANARDSLGEYETPLLFCLTAGEHVLEVTQIAAPMAIQSFTFHGISNPPSYQAMLARWKAEGMKPVNCGLCTEVQGENMQTMSDPTIQPGSSSYPSMTPPANGYFILNELSGRTFQYPAQWVQWTFTVPKTGLYKLGFRVLQAGQGGGLVGTPVTRTLLIDGKVPFNGAQWVTFPFNNDWQIVTLAQPNGQPALIGLTKGTHTLRLETTLGLLGQSLATLERTTQFLGELQRQVLLITGPNPNPNVTYDLGSSLPFLIPDMRAAVRVLEQQAAYLTYTAGGQVPDAANTVLIAAQDMARLAAHPDLIPLSMTEWQNDESSLAAILTQMQDQALSIDWFGFAAPSYQWPSASASLWQSLSTTWRTFILSFYRNYTDVGSVYQHAITVWVGWGQTWAKVMSQMSASEFTPVTGIHVNYNVVPGGSGIVLLAEASGHGPDVATGMTTTNPVDFALRGGAYNLTKFPGWSTVAARFAPGELIPYTYTNAAGQTGVYGVPETEGMMMMMYRKDILQSLHVAVPQTWPEVYKLIPTLQAHGMEFYYPAGPQGFLPFLYQNGGHYYEKTSDGIRSAIDSEGGYLGFKAWTDLFDEWQVPLSANFFTRFETGEMPIGITDYPTFVTITVAAPQLAGLWSVAPIPATPYECTPSGACQVVSQGPCAFGNPNHPLVLKDGNYCKYNDTSGDLQESTTIIIPSNAQHPLQAWKWVEWWTSAPVQLEFAHDIQAIGGTQLAWNTANIQALPDLPWPSQDLKVMEESRLTLHPEPMVPGGYISDRYINDIWTNVVISGENARQQLLWAVQNINDELYRMEAQFGLIKVGPGVNRYGIAGA
jgi:hypothetical protein